MGEHSEIQWTTHTFNGWSGCEKVSEGCKFCYAAAAPPSMRRGAEWGPEKERVLASDSYWDQPLRWFKAAVEAKERHRVFAHSMSDVFEDRDDLDPWRDRVLVLTQFTRGTPTAGGLDWLFLTKRTDKALRYLSDPGLYDRLLVAARWWRERHPELYSSPVDNPRQESFHVWYPNVWIGASVENQDAATKRIPSLLQLNARVRFLSCEPLLGAVDLTAIKVPSGAAAMHNMNALAGYGGFQGDRWNHRLHWVIAGGESGRGRNTRPPNPDWMRSLRDQCAIAGVPYFLKQWGEWAPDCLCGGSEACRTTPRPAPGSRGVMFLCGKANAGRKLDGRTHDDFPAPS